MGRAKMIEHTIAAKVTQTTMRKVELDAIASLPRVF